MTYTPVYPATYEAGYGTSTELPVVGPVTPVRDLTTEDVLYGDRVTEYRWEVLRNVNGVDELVGVLDGVSAAGLKWSTFGQVKGSGTMRVADLDTPTPGMLTVADVNLTTVRLRPVCMIQGLPEIPLSVFLVSAAVEEWTATGRGWAVELLDKGTVLVQDKVAETYSVAADTVILEAVQDVVESAGESIEIDPTVTSTLSVGMVWPAGTSKLTIVNELLDAAGHSALWVDGKGRFRATPYVLPADRGTRYELLGIPRELVDGAASIYGADWSRDRDQWNIPNRVVAVSSGGGDAEALTGTYDNTDPDSPFSYPSRGRWITQVLDGVEVPDGTTMEQEAFLEAKARQHLVSASSVQAQVQVTHLPIPIRVSEVLRFAHTLAGVDARHVVTRIELDAQPLGLMRSELVEVVDL